MAFPTSIPSNTDPTSLTTLAGVPHAELHQSHNAEIVAIETKLGTGSSSATIGKVLRATGTGTSAWGQVDPTIDIATFTSATLRSLLTDETGTGAAVFATTPTITTPNITTSINDANGNEVIKVPATASATNEITVTNAANGSDPVISATGSSDANVNLNLQPKGSTGIVQLLDANGNEVIKAGVATASAVNEVTITNAATANGPIIKATGGDTNTLLDIRGKGTGGLGFEFRTQNDNSNTITSATTPKVKIQTGWGQILGNGTTAMSETVTFPSAITTPLSLSVNFLGFKSGGTVATDMTQFNTKVGSGYTVEGVSITTTQFTVMFSGASNFGAAYHGYSWTIMAI